MLVEGAVFLTAFFATFLVTFLATFFAAFLAAVFRATFLAAFLAATFFTAGFESAVLGSLELDLDTLFGGAASVIAFTGAAFFLGLIGLEGASDSFEGDDSFR